MDQDVMVNGRPFKLDIHGTEHEDRKHWIAWVTVVGREHMKGGSWNTGACLSEGEAREKAYAWMRKYRQ
jgi:hypothetical protein